MDIAGRKRVMKKNSFDLAMQQIENEFESKKQEADRLARRAVIMARIRKAVGVLLLLGLCGTAYAFRGEIQGAISAKLTTPQTQAQTQGQASSPKGATSASIQRAQDNAKTRDALVDSLAK